MSSRYTFSLRAKLLLLSLAVLAIPYTGFQYLRELERYLRDSLEASLVDAARAVAAPLHEHAELFPVSNEPVDRTVYVHKLEHPIQLDGYTDDWLSYLDWSTPYAEKDSGRADPLSYRFLISRYHQYYYALLQIHDGHLVYQQPDTPGALDNDHVELVYSDADGVLQHCYFSPSAPGRMHPFSLRTTADEFGVEYRSVESVTNISGVWQPVDGGYNLEIAIPVSLVGDHLGFIVSDVDDAKTRRVGAAVGTAGAATRRNPGRILQYSPGIEAIIENLAQVSSGRRIWVLDNRGQVLAGTGTLNRQDSSAPVNPLYRLILPAIHQRFHEDLSGTSRLQGEEITRALAGHAQGRWRRSPDGKAVIISAAAPVRIDGAVRGAVVVEEATTGIQMQQRRAMARLFNQTLLVFGAVTVLLLLFATRLSYRLRRLGRDADAAIDEHGRVTGLFSGSRAGDEIGELSRNYAAILERLKQYNDYLEMMAGRLSHELRTPITVVRSSLDNLGAGDDSERETYLQRAREGIERLNLIVTRLSEATRLEQALQSAEKQDTDITALLKGCVEGYRSAYPRQEIVLQAPPQSLHCRAAPELLVQMLDKLVANAVDFSRGGQTVEIRLRDGRDEWELAVTNHGSRLPESMDRQLFNSMVSVREKKGDEPHLGLGLYIVRLISEYHGGHVTAENGPDGDSVTFRISFPKGV